MEALNSRDIQKIEAIKGLLIAWRVGGHDDTAFSTFDQLAHHSALLKGRLGLERIFSIIQEGTDRNIMFEFVEEKVLFESAVSTPHRISKAIRLGGVEIHVSDPIKIEEYFASLMGKFERSSQKTISPDDKAFVFILNENAKLSLAGSKRKPYEMKRGRGLHRLVYYLAKLKKPVGTQELARHFHTDAPKLRRRIERLRTEIHDRLDVSRTALIKTTPKGYSITSVDLKVPKGYTP